MAEKNYCGKTEAEVRTAYFTGKLKKFLNEIQNLGKYTDGQIQALGAYLAKLKEEDDSVVERISEYSGIDLCKSKEIKPPAIDELVDGGDDSEWRDKADATQAFLDKTLLEMRQGISSGKRFERGFWLKTATVINTVQDVLDKDRVYCDQKYRAKITGLIDDFETSRAEAEERAKLTPEYAKYKNAVLQKDRLDELVNICKKHDSKEQ